MTQILLKDICPSFSCPSCKKILNFFYLHTVVAKFCRENLRIFSADFFDLKSKIRRHIYFLDVWVSSVYVCVWKGCCPEVARPEYHLGIHHDVLMKMERKIGFNLLLGLFISKMDEFPKKSKQPLTPHPPCFEVCHWEYFVNMH